MGFHLLLAIVASNAGEVGRLDVCHPLWLSRTPSVRLCGETLGRLRALELRALRHYFRPGAGRGAQQLGSIARDAEARLPALSAYGRTAALFAMIKRQANRGRLKARDIARLCDAAAALQEEIVGQRGTDVARREHLTAVLELRAKLSDLRRRVDWAAFSGRERREILRAFALWAQLASEALDRVDAVVVESRPDPLCGLLAAYVRQTVRISARSMQHRAKELLPGRRWLILPEGTRSERRAASGATARIGAVLRRCSGGPAERLEGTDDRRAQSAVRALHNLQAEEALRE